MQIQDVKFLTSSDKINNCPKVSLPEFALIGRSNVGKSSLINMLFNNKNLAKVSSTPGKTKLINHFIVNKKLCIVDLPGYGWAKVSKTTRSNWKIVIEEYLTKRKELYGVFILIDSRLKPQKIDLEFINWLGKNKIPFSIIFTKIDKLSKQKLEENSNLFQTCLLETWSELPPFFFTSSQKKIGSKEIMNYISSVL